MTASILLLENLRGGLRAVQMKGGALLQGEIHVIAKESKYTINI
jgi:hypothetical protein